MKVNRRELLKNAAIVWGAARGRFSSISKQSLMGIHAPGLEPGNSGVGIALADRLSIGFGRTVANAENIARRRALSVWDVREQPCPVENKWL